MEIYEIEYQKVKHSVLFFESVTFLDCRIGRGVFVECILRIYTFRK